MMKRRNHPTDITDAERAAALTDRITRALTALQAAPDTLGDDASKKRQARDVATANRIAWAILSEGLVPRHIVEVHNASLARRAP